MVFTVDGVDLSPFICENGIKWQRNDIDGPDTGRTLDSIMHRERVAVKIRLDITCRPMYTSETRIVLNAILPQYIMVTYEDPMYGIRTVQMYSNNVPATEAIDFGDGEALWNGITFPLIER